MVRLPVDRAAARVDINLAHLEESRSFPEVSAHPEEQDDGQGEVDLEETFSVVGWLAVEPTDRPDRNVELWFG